MRTALAFLGGLVLGAGVAVGAAGISVDGVMRRDYVWPDTVFHVGTKATIIIHDPVVAKPFTDFVGLPVSLTITK